MPSDFARIVIAKPPRRSKWQGLAKLPPDAPRIIRPKPGAPPDHSGDDAADELWREIVRRVTADQDQDR